MQLFRKGVPLILVLVAFELLHLRHLKKRLSNIVKDPRQKNKLGGKKVKMVLRINQD